MLAYQYLQTLPQLAQAQGNTFWVIPSEVTTALKTLSGAAFGGSGDDGGPPASPPPVRSVGQPGAVESGAIESADAALKRAGQADGAAAGAAEVKMAAQQDAELTAVHRAVAEAEHEAARAGYEVPHAYAYNPYLKDGESSLDRADRLTFHWSDIHKMFVLSIYSHFRRNLWFLRLHGYGQRLELAVGLLGPILREGLEVTSHPKRSFSD